MTHACHRVVVEVEVRDLEVLGNGRAVHRVGVVLGADLHPARGLVAHRVVRTVVAEGHLEGLRPEHDREDLVAEADAEDRLHLHQLTGRLDDARHGGRVARPVRQEDPVGLQREDLGRGRRAGHDRHVEADVHQAAQDVPLHARVDGDDLEAVTALDVELGRVALVVPLAPLVGLLAGDLGREVPSVRGRGGLGLGDEGGGVAVLGRDDAAQGAVLADEPRDAARVDALDGDDALLDQPLGEGEVGAVVGRDRGELADHERLGPGALRLRVLAGDAVVPDERVGHGHDLSGVGGIGEDLLVARHGGVEDEVAPLLARGAHAAPLEHLARLERQPGLLRLGHASVLVRFIMAAA